MKNSNMNDFLRKISILTDSKNHEQSYKDAKKAWEYLSKIKKNDLHYPTIIKAYNILCGNTENEDSLKKDEEIVTETFNTINIKTLIKHMLTNYIVQMRRGIDTVTDSNHPIEYKEDLAKRSYLFFMKIKPFKDNNEGIGGLLWQWHRQKMKLPIKSANHEYEKELFTTKH